MLVSSQNTSSSSRLSDSTRPSIAAMNSISWLKNLPTGSSWCNRTPGVQDDQQAQAADQRGEHPGQAVEAEVGVQADGRHPFGLAQQHLARKHARRQRHQQRERAAGHRGRGPRRQPAPRRGVDAACGEAQREAGQQGQQDDQREHTHLVRKSGTSIRAMLKGGAIVGTPEVHSGSAAAAANWARSRQAPTKGPPAFRQRQPLAYRMPWVAGSGRAQLGLPASTT